MNLPPRQSFIPFIIIAIFLGVIALGVWIVAGGPNPFAGIAGERTEYVPSFEDPQTYEGEKSDDFVFQYPPKFNVTEIPVEGGGKRILVESTEALKGFEVTMLPFDESGPITEQRIKRDLPGVPVENPRNAFVGQSQIPGIAFYSADQYIGQTFEIWFVHKGYIYQALTYPEFAGTMEEILKTWKFK